jgi:hypothetical protein
MYTMEDEVGLLSKDLRVEELAAREPSWGWITSLHGTMFCLFSFSRLSRQLLL